MRAVSPAGFAVLMPCCVSAASCCINREAAQATAAAVFGWKRRTKSKMKVIFDGFKPVDNNIHRGLLGVRG